MTIELHAQIFPHDVFTLVTSVREFPGQDEVALCRQRIASCPSEIQGVRVAMGRHEQLPRVPTYLQRETDDRSLSQPSDFKVRWTSFVD